MAQLARRTVRRALPGLAIAALLAAALRITGCAPAPRPTVPPSAAEAPPIPPPRPLSHDCRAAGWEAAAGVNDSSLAALPWTPFGREETGWRIYAPLIAHEIGVDCPPQSSGFARALAAWQQRQGLPADGLVSQVTFLSLKAELQSRRPFVRLSKQGICVAPADEAGLATLRADEALGDRPVQLRPGALAAWRLMVAAARANVPAIAADPELLRVFSGYRSPDYDAQRCAAQGNCNGRERAICSSHRTGLAMDLYLGHAPGLAADSSADENRLLISQGPAYRWLVANADRFGFVNYPFEPWHWEWTGDEATAP